MKDVINYSIDYLVTKLKDTKSINFLSEKGFSYEILNDIKNVISINFYEQKDTFCIENYFVLGDDSVLKIAIDCKNGNVFGIDIDKNNSIKEKLFINSNIECLVETLIFFRNMIVIKEDERIKLITFIRQLLDLDKTSLQKGNWWYLFLSNSIIDGINIDDIIRNL